MIENLKTALILCAGYGTRLRPLTDKLPKPLLPVRGKPAIFAVMDKLRAAGVDDFLINVHHLPEKFAEIFGLPPDAFKKERLAKTQYCGSSVRLVFEPQILDTGGSVKNILPLIDNSKPLVVHNGDIYFDCPADKFLSAAQENVSDAACAATLCLRSGGNMPNVGVDALGNVCDMRFALAAPHEKNAQYAGFFVLNPPIFDRFRRAKTDKFSVVDIFLDVLRSGERIAGFFAAGGEWADIGTRAEYERLNSIGLPDEWAALAELCECGFEPNEASIRKVAKGASTRAFYRFCNGGEKLVGCFYSDLPRENFLYAPIAEFLYSCGVPVPKILFHDAQKRIIVMEDAGARDIGELQLAERRGAYFAALRAAKILHTKASEKFSANPIELCPSFDADLYRWEQDYFYRECAQGVFGINIPRPDSDFEDLTRRLLDFPRRLLFRDFQSQNIMVSEGGDIRVIDFQGMRLGNPFYDVASLLFDPYVERLGGEFIDEALGEYLNFLPDASFPSFAESREMLNFAGVERLLQALGAYGFLSAKKGKTEYVKYFAPAAANLLGCAEKCGLSGIVEFASAILEKTRR